MNNLWIINYKTDVGFPLDETVLVKAISESHARTRFLSYIENCNEECQEIEIFDYVVTGVEPYDVATHGPECFHERIEDHGY